jgi:hypothetical protein
MVAPEIMVESDSYHKCLIFSKGLEPQRVPAVGCVFFATHLDSCPPQPIRGKTITRKLYSILN